MTSELHRASKPGRRSGDSGFLRAMAGGALWAAAALAIVSVCWVPPATAAAFTVDSIVDAVDANPGDGFCATASSACTLRAAIQETNALPGADLITVPAGHYVLAVAGTDEDAAATGDLDVTDTLTLVGAGAGETILDANGIDGVLDIHSGDRMEISNVTITGGLFWDFFVGGAVRSSFVPLSIRGSTISHNRGGIVYLGFGWLFLINSTVSENETSCSRGSGECISPAINAWNSSLYLVHSTVVGNRSLGADPSPSISTDTLSLSHSIISNPDAPSNCSTSSVSISGGYNIDSDGSCQVTDPSDLSNVNPLVGPLQDNGGPTPTHALLPGSPAINAIPLGDCTYDDDGDPGTPEVPLTADQRGVARPQGDACDIGAYEVTACADGRNNDGDAFIDAADPGCRDATSVREDPQCQDGINNDPGQDDLIDFDGGLTALGYVATDPDPQCVGKPWKNNEFRQPSCGLGAELALILPPLMRLYMRRRSRI